MQSSPHRNKSQVSPYFNSLEHNYLTHSSCLSYLTQIDIVLSLDIRNHKIIPVKQLSLVSNSPNRVVLGILKHHIIINYHPQGPTSWNHCGQYPFLKSSITIQELLQYSQPKHSSDIFTSPLDLRTPSISSHPHSGFSKSPRLIRRK